jgi:threonine dehydrogenase-like Zn-dependent dehydrogenase
VLGAGSLGLLCTALLRLDEVTTWTADVVPDDHPKARLVKKMGAYYINSSGMSARDLVNTCSLQENLNIIIEASGAAKEAIDLINYLARSSIYIMTGIPQQGLMAEVDAAQIIRKIVRENQVIVGSVNSNRRHFEIALKHLPEINRGFDGMLTNMITQKIKLQDYHHAFDSSKPGQKKT